MKQLIISSMLLLAALCGHGQNAKRLPDGNYAAISTRSADSATATNTGRTYTDNKGTKFPVYETAKGKLFVIRTSAKSGKTYKQYLKLESK